MGVDDAVANDVMHRLPWPLMLVQRSGDLSTNERLLVLLRVDAATPAALAERFEITRFGGQVLTDRELPWQRASSGETFIEEQTWYDHRTSERLLLELRCEPWASEQMAILFDNVSEHPFLLRRAELAASVGGAMLRAQDPAEVAHAIVEDVSRAVGAEAVFLLDAPAHERRLRLLASVGLPAAFIEDHQSISLEMPNVLALAARTRTLQEVDRIESLPERDFEGTRRLLALGLHSTVAVPLIASSELAGVLGLAWRHPGKMDRVERRALRAMASVCALGLQHARLHAAERREMNRLRTLRDAALAVETAVPIRDLLRLLVEQACELTRARYGALGVVNPEGNGLSDFIYSGVPAEVAKRIGHLPEGRGLLGAVVRERKAIRVSDVGHDPRAVGFPPHHPTMTSFLGVPLRVGREIFGNFYLCDKDGGAPFTDEDEALLELYGAQSALAIGYARQIQLAEHAHRDLDRLRDELAAVIAHDLRSPVAAMLLQIEALIDTAGGDGPVAVPRPVLERLQRSAGRIAQMARDLLDASWIELGRLPLDRQSVSAVAAVQSLVAQLAPVLAQHPLKVEVREPVPPVLVDPARFDQILTNLLENGAKYSPPGAPITVTIEGTEGGAVVTVADRGHGIAADELPRLFDRFYQAPRARAQKTGLGLGLYIAKGLVEGHGGRIWVESEPDNGSHFHVWMPGTESALARASTTGPAL